MFKKYIILAALLMSSGLSFGAASPENEVNANQEAFFEAVSADQFDAAIAETRLKEADVDINARNKHGCTALQQAVTDMNADAVQFLVDHKAGLEWADRSGVTPLCEAATNGYDDITDIPPVSPQIPPAPSLSTPTQTGPSSSSQNSTRSPSQPSSTGSSTQKQKQSATNADWGMQDGLRVAWILTALGSGRKINIAFEQAKKDIVAENKAAAEKDETVKLITDESEIDSLAAKRLWKKHKALSILFFASVIAGVLDVHGWVLGQGGIIGSIALLSQTLKA